MKNKTHSAEKIVDAYQKKGEALIDHMLTILIRAQRKVDDGKYREALEKLENK